MRIQEVAGFVLWESVYAPYLKIPEHSHTEGGYFDFILNGGYTELSKQGDREFTQSTVIFHPPGESHADQFHNEKTRLLSIRFSTDWFSRLEGTAGLNAPAYFRGGLMTQLAVRLYNEFREADAVSSLVIEGLALEMLAYGSRESSNVTELATPRVLRQAQELLHARFNERLTLSSVAASVGVHPVHLNRVFRQHYHCTVGEYLRWLRIEFACQKLSSSQDSLVEIALAAGFYDQSHFCRVFQRFTGLTASQYRTAFNNS